MASLSAVMMLRPPPEGPHLATATPPDRPRLDDLWRSGPVYSASDRPLARLVARPVREFLRVEAAGSIILLLAAATALLWANSPWSSSYDALWHTHLTLDVGPLHLDQSLQHWVNDALMAIFFFVVGLEIKHELVNGDLRDPRTAALPIVAAVGGMVVPAGIYLALNRRAATGSAGWGIPMATDIAFAVGVLGVLGRRIPSAARLFLLTLAIVDDIGAILVIAVFYTSDSRLTWLAIAVGLLGLMVAARMLRIWSDRGLRGPRRRRVVRPARVRRARDPGRSRDRPARPGDAAAQGGGRARFRRARPGGPQPRRRRARPAAVPAPGVGVGGRTAHQRAAPAVGVRRPARLRARQRGRRAGRDRQGLHRTGRPRHHLGLVLGKPIGIYATSFLAVRLGIAKLPEGTSWPMVLGLGAVAGIGFTVSIFIAGLSFPGADLLTEEAKIAILLASLLAAVVGVALLLAATRGRSETPMSEDAVDG